MADTSRSDDGALVETVDGFSIREHMQHWVEENAADVIRRVWPREQLPEGLPAYVKYRRATFDRAVSSGAMPPGVDTKSLNSFMPFGDGCQTYIQKLWSDFSLYCKKRELSGHVTDETLEALERRNPGWLAAVESERRDVAQRLSRVDVKCECEMPMGSVGSGGVSNVSIADFADCYLTGRRHHGGRWTLTKVEGLKHEQPQYVYRDEFRIAVKIKTHIESIGAVLRELRVLQVHAVLTQSPEPPTDVMLVCPPNRHLHRVCKEGFRVVVYNPVARHEKRRRVAERDDSPVL